MVCMWMDVLEGEGGGESVNKRKRGGREDDCK